ncbi:MAG TPA: hypothetical protein VH373_20315 [Jatrophihabitantaceae bacterium]|jgi:hypothetical protein
MSTGQAWGFWVSAGVSLAVSVLWLYLYGMPRAPANTYLSSKFYELERDRVLSAAKGIASTAVGFLTVLVTIFLDRTVPIGIPAWFLVCYVVGAAGCVVVAAWMNGTTRRFVAGTVQ